MRHPDAPQPFGLDLSGSLGIRERIPRLKRSICERRTILAKAEPGKDTELTRAQLSGRMLRVIEYISENLHRPITLADMAEVAALSQYHFVRSFQKAVGTTPMRHVTAQRVKAATRLIESAAMTPIADIALMCGFSSQSHFSEAFKKETGMTPRRYRETILGAIMTWLGLPELLEMSALILV